jgi:polyphosphate kinase
MSPEHPVNPYSQERYHAKELSWLAFNERVLQEAADITVPPIQRLRYLGIFSNNLDEFFRVHVAEIRRLATFSSGSEQIQYKNLLEVIQKRVIELQIHFELIYLNALSSLRKHKIYLINEAQLDEKQSHYVRQFFQKKVQPELMPQLLDDNHPISELTDASIYLAIKLHCHDQIHYALLEVPTERLDRFIPIPQQKGKRGRVYIVLENIIRHCLPKVFRNLFPIAHAEAYTIKLTRDAELELGDG